LRRTSTIQAKLLFTVLFYMSSYAVTGASRGIGIEFVRQLSSNAANTVFALVRNVQGATYLQELANSRSNVYIINADLTDNDTLKAAAFEVGQKTGGSLDCLINNAATIPTHRANYKLSEYAGQEDLLNKDFVDNIQVNVIGIIQTVNAFLPLLKRGKVKKVISLTSAVGDIDFTIKSGFTGITPYSVSKAGVNMVNAKYANEFREDGFLFLAISPGVVNTSLNKPTDEDMVKIIELMECFKKGAPNWNGQPVAPKESVESMLRVIDGFTAADTGAFVSHFGNKDWL